MLGLRSKPRQTQKSELTTDSKSAEPSQKDVDKLLATISFPLDEETIQQNCSNPDPQTAFNVMVKRRRADVKVSTLSAEQRRELVEAKEKELNTFIKYSVVEAASCQGISLSALMIMRWVVTFKDDVSLRRHGWLCRVLRTKDLARSKRPAPTASRRSRQIFLTLAASLGFSNSQRGREVCISSRGT